MNLLVARSAVAPSVSRSSAASVARRGAILIAASCFVAICAHLTVPLPFTPVPVVLSDFAVILVGLLLGPAMGFGALALYLMEGAAGLPVFSPLGMGGLPQLFGPTAGYLFAYPVAAALAGGLRRAGGGLSGRLLTGVFAACVATAVILLSGAGWLWHTMHLSAAATISMAIVPFLGGAAVKVGTAVAVWLSTEQLRRG